MSGGEKATLQAIALNNNCWECKGLKGNLQQVWADNIHSVLPTLR